MFVVNYVRKKISFLQVVSENSKVVDHFQEYLVVALMAVFQ